ncbi:serine/threonine-protein kinase mos [Cloeon dipterum]|uniref:serine/threonine-protein kinase mos n=1 Tax=Cloeon dipterum TaxID=197152 RepID=UPI0032206DDD
METIKYTLNTNNLKSPRIYVLTPEEIPLGKKYKYGQNRTFRTRFIEDKGIVQKLAFETEVEELNTPARNFILRGEESAETLKFDSLGKGGFGSVFLAVSNNRLVACKVIKLGSANSCITFQRERNALGLQHKHVVETLSVVQGPKAGIIIMEKANNVNLQEVLDGGLLKSDRAKIRCISELCFALQYLHEHNILHLDVKPLNMLIGRDGSMKLADFGNSSLANGFGNFYSMGTVRYTDPMIFKNKKATTKSDVYSVGITMWQLVFNTVPYKGIANDGSLMYQIVRNHLRPTPNEHDPARRSCGLRVFEETFKCCWNKEPDCRPTLDVILRNMQASMRCVGPDDKWVEGIH